MAWWLDWTGGKALFFSVGSVLSFLGVALMVSLGIIGELRGPE
jgi:hypothetical protein